MVLIRGTVSMVIMTKGYLWPSDWASYRRLDNTNTQVWRASSPAPGLTRESFPQLLASVMGTVPPVGIKVLLPLVWWFYAALSSPSTATATADTFFILKTYYSALLSLWILPSLLSSESKSRHVTYEHVRLRESDRKNLKEWKYLKLGKLFRKTKYQKNLTFKVEVLLTVKNFGRNIEL